MPEGKGLVRIRWMLILFLILPMTAHGTVNDTATSVSFICAGSTGPYPFTFPISDPTALTVTQNGTALASTAYTVTPVNNNYTNGGSVTLNAACPSAQTLVLKRNTPLTQASVFTDNMPLPYKTFERGLDKLTEITQELQLADWTALLGRQGSDNNLLTSGAISGTGSNLCTDANGGATTSGCSVGGGGGGSPPGGSDTELQFNDNGVFNGSSSATYNKTTGRLGTGNLNDILIVDGVKYATCAAAVTAAGSNNRIILVPSTYAGAECPSTLVDNITFWDLRGGSHILTNNSVSWNSTSASGLVTMLRGVHTNSAPTVGGSVAGYFQEFINNATAGANSNADGGSFELDVTGTLTGTLATAQGAENPVLVTSTGGNITEAVGTIGYLNTLAGSTTPIGTFKGIYGLGCNSIAGSNVITNCYGGYFPEQTAATGRNYAMVGYGLNLLGYGTVQPGSFLDAEDSSHAAHRFLVVDSSDNTIVRAIGTNGLFLQDSTGATQAKVTSAGVAFNTSATPISEGAITLGSALLPWGGLYLGNAATNAYLFSPGTTAAPRTISITDPGLSTVSLPLFTGTWAAGQCAVASGTTNVFSLSVCGGGGGGNTTSTALTTNVLPKANGANSIVNSSITDNGTAVSTTEGFTAATVTATSLTTGNCVQASTAGLLTTVSGPCGTSSGTLTATGSPSANELAMFSGATSLTNSNLSGDVTTVNTLATTVVKLEGIALPTLAANTGFLYDAAGTLSLNASASNLTAGTLPIAQLPTIPNASLANSTIAFNGQTQTLGAANINIPFQVNSVNQTSQAGINEVTSSVNSVGLTDTPINTGTNVVEHRITGSSYTGNAATATNLSTTGSTGTFWGVSGSTQGWYSPSVSLAFPLTVSGTVNSGGIPYFNSSVQESSSAVLPSGDFVLGGGAGGAPTATFSVVPAANGGLGAASLTAHGLLVAEGSSAAVSVTGTAGTCLLFNGTSADPSAQACPGNNMSGGTLYGMAYAAGATTITSNAPPTTKGLWYGVWNLSTDAAAAPTSILAGITDVAITGASTTYSVIYSNNLQIVEHDSAATHLVTVTIPTPTTLENPNFGFSYVNHTSSYTDVLSPTTWTINGGATISVTAQSQCRVSVDPFNSNNWLADCSPVAAFVGVTNIATTSPISGGPITSTGTVSCPTCAIGPGASVTSGDVASFNGTGGLILQDAGIVAANLNTNAVNFTSGNVVVSSGNHTTADGGVAPANIPTMAAAGASGDCVQFAGNNKTLSDCGFLASNIAQINVANTFVAGQVIPSFYTLYGGVGTTAAAQVAYGVGPYASGNVTGYSIFGTGDTAGTAGNSASITTVRGGDATGATGANTGGNLLLRAGQVTSTTGIPGLIQVVGNYLKGATVTQYDVECMSADETIADCGASPTNMVGIALTATAPIQVVVSGEALVNTSNTAVVGDNICAGASSPLGTDNGTGACAAGSLIGVVKSITKKGAGSTLPLVALHALAPGGSGGVAKIPIQLPVAVAQGTGVSIGGSGAAATLPGVTYLAGSSTAPQVGVQVYAFASIANPPGQYVDYSITLPSSFTAIDSITFKVSNDAVTTGTDYMDFQYKCVADGAPETPTYASYQQASGAVPGTTGQIVTLTLSSPTISGCSAGNVMFVRIGAGTGASVFASGNLDLYQVKVELH